MSLVLDASVALAWIFERPTPAEASLADACLGGLADEPAWVPSLWHTEVANSLLVAERRGVVSEAQVIDFAQRLSRLPLLTDDLTVASRQEAVMSLGRQHQLTAYDATYLELALRKGATLATFDTRLARAMTSAGGALYGSPPS